MPAIRTARARPVTATSEIAAAATSSTQASSSSSSSSSARRNPIIEAASSAPTKRTRSGRMESKQEGELTLEEGGSGSLSTGRSADDAFAVAANIIQDDAADDGLEGMNEGGTFEQEEEGEQDAIDGVQPLPQTEVERGMPDFLSKTYAICHMIPRGQVTSYGHIAKLAGYPNYSRHVGNAMRDLPNGSSVPWQRVLSSSGHISPRDPLAMNRQLVALEAEGVEVITGMGGGVNAGLAVEGAAGGGGGRGRVDLRRWGWFPTEVDV